MKSKSSSLMLILALALAFLGAFLVSEHVKGVERKAAEMQAVVQAEEMVTVVYTAKDIPAQREVLPDALTTKSVPRSFVPADAVINIDEAKDDKGMPLYSKMPLVADEVLRRSKITTRALAVGLTYRIPEGKRAITVSISETKAVAYAINPGDRVDIIAYFTKEDSGGGEGSEGGEGEMTQTVLQDMEILEISTADPTNPNQRSGAPTATFAATPEQAEIIALLEQKSSMILVLRPFEDREVLPSEGTSIADVLGDRDAERPKAAAPVADPGRVIEIFSGSSRSSTSVNR